MDLIIGYIAAALALVCAVLAAASIWICARIHRDAAQDRAAQQELAHELAQAHAAIADLKSGITQLAHHAAAESASERTRYETLTQALTSSTERTDTLRREVSQQLAQNRTALDSRLDKVAETTQAGLTEVRSVVDRQLTGIRSDTNTQLDRMRATVDEKLQQTLNDRITQSFRLVNDRLQQVDQGLGEMKTLAQDVGGLKKVLSNVKTRGIMGEVQLGAILREILSPGQFEENVATVPGSAERVEFAVKLPGDGGETVYLPIDAKFPGDTYEHLRDAQDAGDGEAVAAAWRTLEGRLRDEARDIQRKYIAPPATTTFAILFLPFEGLYAEVANRPGLIERLQREHRVNVAGPSTMAALLNSLEMGFQTVAIQRRADEIQRVLAAVKTEFGKYQTELKRAQKQLGTASRTIDALAGTRSRALERRLRDITQLDSLREAETVLGIEDADQDTPAGDPADSKED